MSFRLQFKKFNFHHIWDELSSLGVHDFLDVEQQKKTIFVNRIAIMLLAISTITAIISFSFLGKSASGLRLISLSAMMVGVLAFNHFQFHKTARNTLLLAPGIIVCLIPLITGNIILGTFLWIPYAAASFSVVPLFLLNFKTDKWAILISSGFYLVLTSSIDVFFNWRTGGRLPLEFISQNYVSYKLPQISFWVFLNVAFYSLIMINRRHERNLAQLNRELNSQSEEIQTQTEAIQLQNNELLEKHEEIETINQNLEMILDERTKVIEDRNKQIIDYAYFNAHQVRGPLARILGLINLTHHETNPEELLDIVKRMDESAQELNLVIIKINKILEDESGAKNDDFISS